MATILIKFINIIISCMRFWHIYSTGSLDFTRAFDTIDHDILLSLLSRFGFSESVINWVASYLSNRLQSVRYVGATSQSLHVLDGAPQGSILGPTLFIIYLNSLLPLLPSKCCFAYADDLTLIALGKNSDDAVNALQLLINIVLLWSESHHLFMNLAKSKWMLILPIMKRHTVPNTTSCSKPSVLKLSSTELEQTNSLRPFGIIHADNYLGSYNQL